MATELTVIGRVAVLHDGRTVAIRSRKPAALLTYLALAPRRTASREQLAALLWGDMGDDRARHNLRQALALIRRESATDFLQNDLGTGSISLTLPAESIDVSRFEACSRSNDEDQLREGLELFAGGELLGPGIPPEEPFEDWLHAQRRRLRGLAETAWDRLAHSIAADDERGADAIDAARSWLALEPTSQRAHRLMMRLLFAAGEAAAAIRQYERCAEILRDELGVEPDTATRALRAELVRQSGESPADNPLPVPTKPSLAVLPFEQLGPEDERAYFAEGITEDVLTGLSSSHALFVVSRSTSFSYRGQPVTAEQAGRELGVQYVVEGSVREMGDTIRVTAHLVDAATGRQLWSNRYDGPTRNLFALQDELVRAIVATVAGRVEADSIARAHRKPPADLGAYDYVLKGIDLHRRETIESTRQALDLFNRALELDEEYALAHVWVACSIGQLCSLSDDPNSDIVESSISDPGEIERQLGLAYQALQRSQALDEDEAECHRLLGAIELFHGDFHNARSHIERAYALNPNSDLVLSLLGELEIYAGNAAAGVDWVRQAMRANPYHGDAFWRYLGRGLYHLGEFDEALAALSRTHRRPTSQLAIMAACAARAGDLQRADALRRSVGDVPIDRLSGGMKYAHDSDLQYLRDGLELAGFTDPDGVGRIDAE